MLRLNATPIVADKVFLHLFCKGDFVLFAMDLTFFTSSVILIHYLTVHCIFNPLTYAICIFKTF